MAKKDWTRCKNSEGASTNAWVKPLASLVELEIVEENHGHEVPGGQAYMTDQYGHNTVLAVSLWVRGQMEIGPKYSGSLLGAKFLAKSMEKEWRAK